MSEKNQDEQFPVRVGEVLAGKYRVTRILGNGAMGVVVAAMHEQLEELVAIKLMLSVGMGRPEFIERFTREARAAVKIKNQHVARVLDVGTLEDGRLYMVMEYLEGTDLGKMLVDRGPLHEDVAVDFVLQACEALVEAHALGIVHRDLKPSNLFVTETATGVPLVKVLDFGISKVARKDQPDDSRLTSTAAIMGSPLYMSPEQIRSAKDVDARSDIWALGVILHELLTARVPFVGDTHMAILAAISADTPILLREHRPDASPELEAIIARCLDKDPNKRFQTVMEFARALGPHGPEDAVPSIELALRQAMTGRTSGAGLRISYHHVDVLAETAHTIAEKTPNRRKQRLFAMATVAGGIAAVATAAFLTARSTAPSDSGAAQGSGAAVAASSPSAQVAAASASAAPAAQASSSAAVAVAAAPSEPSSGASSEPAASAVPAVTPASTIVAASDKPKADTSAKPVAKTVASGTPSLPASSGGIRLGKEIDTRR